MSCLLRKVSSYIEICSNGKNERKLFGRKEEKVFLPLEVSRCLMDGLTREKNGLGLLQKANNKNKLCRFILIVFWFCTGA